MNGSLFRNVRREDFKTIAEELINNHCILKHDRRDESVVIYRFAEIEFYLYDVDEPDVDNSTYGRDCKCGEWFLHYSGVDIAFETAKDGNKLTCFGGILIRGVEIYKQNEQETWDLVGFAGGPMVALCEIFNHCRGMPEIISLPEAFKDRDRMNGEPTERVGIGDRLRQRYVADGVDFNTPTDRIVREKNRFAIKKCKRTYNPVPGKNEKS